MSEVHQPFSYSPAREKLGLALKGVAGANNIERLKLLYHGWSYLPIMGYIPINGWLATGEAISLYNTARALPEKNPVVVEIGSWQGKSSVVIAKGLQGKTNPRFFCIDPFNADGDAASLDDYSGRLASMNISLREQFEKNLSNNRVLDMVTVLQGYSHDFTERVEDPVDFLFIDGNHEYNAVRKDFEDWSPKLKPGGWIGFHDVSFNNLDTGPQQLIREEVLEQAGWEQCTHAQSLFLARKSASS